jgi:hypothetical protein
MHFTQTIPKQQAASTTSHSQWHNTTLNGMVEISHPVNLYKECKGQPWKQVTVEFAFVTGLTTIAVDSVMNSVIPVLSFVNMYAPWEVNTVCTQASINPKVN